MLHFSLDAIPKCSVSVVPRTLTSKRARVGPLWGTPLVTAYEKLARQLPCVST
ncbi:hypothetical protein FA13DRAFT_1286995 [Coprinellus micaceus]|uniref:Uncharacterized protein n=1 Tax=Coprinellus micaceus TaxID=71717 RepID=A0A4Y7ST11_COPMI|nr:hypothetical protein FA13DRAFT_1286995 [Coprinellus micaceus]